MNTRTFVLTAGAVVALAAPIPFANAKNQLGSASTCVSSQGTATKASTVGLAGSTLGTDAAQDGRIVSAKLRLAANRHHTRISTPPVAPSVAKSGATTVPVGSNGLLAPPSTVAPDPAALEQGGYYGYIQGDPSN